MKDITKFLHLVTLLTAILLSSSAFGKPTKQTILDFVVAFNGVYQPQMTDKDLDKYMSFFTDDVIDYHAAYGVTIKGKEKPREGLKEKKKSSVRYEAKAQEIIIGINTAVFLLLEDAEYYKNGKLKHFKGRTIIVLEFDDNDLIKHMRRYLD